ncbi:MAG: 3-deoxy-manno-octulosonate cytidylyltransferase [Candidatus Omnitrophota bacterium]|nr:3-deoxy-manno-octulosonate cytidylyltransferase [Candidatus Omnitrophota bacterium]
MNVIGVIPARYASTRFEGKVLANLLGKPMIQYVWERAKQSKLLDDLIIACDDERVEKVAKEFGAKVVSTAKEHSSGSDRLTEIVHGVDVKIIVNIQADEPLIHFTMIDDVSRALLEDNSLVMSTLVKKIYNKDEYLDSNVVKVVVDKNGFALYFSRAPIPYLREQKNKEFNFAYKHIGLYAYTKDFLFTFKNLPVSKLENLEKLEQLRVLEAGYKIKVLETKYDTVGVDTPEDLGKVEQLLRKSKRDD